MESWDNLKELTKAEIIEFLKTQYFYKLPTARQVKSFKWRKESERLNKMMDEHLKNEIDPELIKKRDEYARQFNATSDITKRMNLLEKIKPIDEMISDHMNEYKTISAQQTKNDKYYNSFQ